MHGGPAALAVDHVHTFTIGARLEAAAVIPGDGDREVPGVAHILVQFNRSVAPLTALEEGPALGVLEFTPSLAGQGEWLNTSLYRFTPVEELQPSMEYRVRIPAGLTSSTDVVLAGDFEWRFGTIQPAVARFEPADGTKFVEPDDPFVVTFNQAMARASVECGLELRASGGPAVAVMFAWSEGDTVVTLTPGRPLALGASYEPAKAISSALIGDVVQATVTVAAPTDRLFARVEDFLPAGLEPIDPQLNIVAPRLRRQLEAGRASARHGAAPAYYGPRLSWYWSPWDQVGQRDDRVVLLAERLPRGVHEYIYYARASTLGDLFVAPAHAEETFFSEVFGRGDSGRFSVSPASSAPRRELGRRGHGGTHATVTAAGQSTPTRPCR